MTVAVATVKRNRQEAGAREKGERDRQKEKYMKCRENERERKYLQ
jgi:hypothetical protein